MEGERSRVMRQSVPKQRDKKSGDHEEEKGSGALKEEIGVWNSQGGRKDTFFPTSLSKDSVQLSCI